MLRAPIAQSALRVFGRASLRSLAIRRDLFSTTCTRSELTDGPSTFGKESGPTAQEVKQKVEEFALDNASGTLDGVWVTAWLSMLASSTIANNGSRIRLHCAPGNPAGRYRMVLQALVAGCMQPQERQKSAYDLKTAPALMVYKDDVMGGARKLGWMKYKGAMVMKVQTEYPDLYAAAQASCDTHKSPADLYDKLLEVIGYFQANWSDPQFRAEIGDMVMQDVALTDREVRRSIESLFGCCSFDIGFCKPGRGDHRATIECMAGRVKLLGSHVRSEDLGRAAILKDDKTCKQDLIAAASFS